MKTGFEFLAAMEYPGRLIVLGLTRSGRPAVLYAVTGRSPSSQARRLVREGSGIWTKPTNEPVLQTGNPDLLVYPAVLVRPGAIAVSNGRQTEAIRGPAAPGESAGEFLARVLAGWEFEPDPPIFTPRISGCWLDRSEAALHIVRRAEDGAARRFVFELPLERGTGRLIATYAGPNRSPLPVWDGPPAEVELRADAAADLVQALYAALAPARGFADFRVAASAVVADERGEAADFAIVNRRERKD